MKVVRAPSATLLTKEDPLILATPKFEAAMGLPSIQVTSTYKYAGRQLLKDQLYDTKNFPTVIKTMSRVSAENEEKAEPDLQKIIDYLKGMPVNKIADFVNCLCVDDPRRLISLFLFSEDHLLLARVWRFITPKQQDSLKDHIPLAKQNT